MERKYVTVLERKQHYSTWGKGFIALGAVLIAIGLSYIFFVPIVQNCPANGCSPLTATEIFGFYWPAFALIFVGIAVLITGISYMVKSRSMFDKDQAR